MLPAVLAILGVAALVAAALRGELNFALLVVFPIVYGTGPLAAVGVLLLMAAAVSLLFTRARPSEAEWDARPDSPAPPPETWAHESPAERPRVRHGGVALIGPFPLAWGSDRTMLVGALVTMLVLVALVFVVMLSVRLL